MRHVVESCERGVSDSVIANVLWTDVTMPGQSGGFIHRMTILMGQNQPKEPGDLFSAIDAGHYPLTRRLLTQCHPTPSNKYARNRYGK